MQLQTKSIQVKRTKWNIMRTRNRVTPPASTKSYRNHTYNYLYFTLFFAQVKCFLFCCFVIERIYSVWEKWTDPPRERDGKGKDQRNFKTYLGIYSPKLIESPDWIETGTYTFLMEVPQIQLNNASLASFLRKWTRPVLTSNDT